MILSYYALTEPPAASILLFALAEYASTLTLSLAVSSPFPKIFNFFSSVDDTFIIQGNLGNICQTIIVMNLL
jgi:hypothetical protein